MKIVILLCFILCLICEFIPEKLNFCNFSSSSNFFDFLYSHKDFFENFALGCLGSSIISYLILSISWHIRENDKMEEMISCMKNILSEYIKIMFRINTVLIKNIPGIELKEMNEKLQIMLKKFNDCKRNICINRKIILEWDEICNNLVFPISKDIDIFFQELDAFLSDATPKEILADNKDMKEKLYKELYNHLDIKYNLEGVYDKISYYILEWKLPNDLLQYESEKMHNSFNKVENAKIHAEYNQIIKDAFRSINKRTDL